jgi:diguanylate cyclase (GGDEF)-like protein
MGAPRRVFRLKRRKLQEDDSAFAGLRDELTNLPTRPLFVDRLSQAIARSARTNEFFAVFYIDIDYFQRINDTYGQDAGDELLKTLARRMRGVTRSVDTLARYDQDFMLITEELHGPADAEKVADKLMQVVRPQFELAVASVFVTLSIGIVLGCGDGAKPEELIVAAEEALTGAKTAGRNCFRFAVPA